VSLPSNKRLKQTAHVGVFESFTSALQLKRDPLGGALPLHKPPSVTDCLYGEPAGR